MKKFAVTLVLVLVASSIPSGNAKAIGEPKYFPLCSMNNTVACFEEVAIKGAGLNGWVVLSGATTSTSNPNGFQFDLSATGYAPSSGYGTNLQIVGYGVGDPLNKYDISVASGNGIARNDQHGTYTKHLDPSTEVRIVLNVKSSDVSNLNALNLTGGSDKTFSQSGSDNLVSFTAKVTHRAGQLAFVSMDAPAASVNEGIIELRASVAQGDMLSSPRVYDGMQVDSNASSFSAPFRTNGQFFDGFKIRLEAPHTLTDGVTLNHAYYSTTIPKNYLDAIGITQQTALSLGVDLAADYSTGAAPTMIPSTVTATPDGGIKIVANGMHYSTPTMETRFKGIPQSADVVSSLKNKKKATLSLKSKQQLALTWKSTSPKICKVTATKKTTKKKVGKKTVKTVTITKWQVQGKKKGTCTVVGTNAGNGSFGPANISKSIVVQ